MALHLLAVRWKLRGGRTHIIDEFRFTADLGEREARKAVAAVNDRSRIEGLTRVEMVGSARVVCGNTTGRHFVLGNSLGFVGKETREMGHDCDE
jgi:hypothetical protein